MSSANVVVNSREVGRIGPGLLVFLGISRDDSDRDTDYMIDKILNLRIFDDGDGTMNLSAFDLDRQIMVISQFTLYGDTRKGRRPSYNTAAPPEQAVVIYREFLDKLRGKGFRPASGVFQEVMTIDAVNDGPVTILIDTARQF